MKRMLKGKNKAIPNKKITYNPITKKFGPEDDSSNIETELSDPEDITVHNSRSDESNIEPFIFPAKWPKGAKSWVWHYIQKGIHGEKNKCLVKKNDVVCGRILKQQPVLTI